MWRFFLFVILFPTLVKSQETNLKTDTVLLKSFNKGDTVVYNIGDNKLYFELPQILKYLKKYNGSNIYKKQDVAILTAALKKPVQGIITFQDTLTYDKQTGYIDTAAISNKYIGALNEIIPNMLSDGHVMILDKKSNRPIPYLVLTKRGNGNYFGAFTEFTAFLPGGKRLCKFIINER